MVILIGSIKGGVGKSTIATNLAAAFQARKINVCLLDADRQGSSFNWANDRAELTHTEIPCFRQYNDVKGLVLRLQEDYEVVIIDCQGRDSIELRSSLVCADVLISPYKPSQLDFDTTHTMSLIVQETKQLNPKLKAYGILSIVSTHSSTQIEVDAAFELAKADENLQLLQTILYDRKAYRDAVSSGQGVVELSNLKAKQEIEALVREIYHEQIKITQ